MTSRERILTTLNGGIPDSVPVVPFIQEEYLAWHYPEKTRLDRVDTVIELAGELSFDVITKHNRFMTPPFLVRNHPNWSVQRKRERDGALWVTQIRIETPDRQLTMESVVPDAGAATQGLMPGIRKHLLETTEDIESFICSLPVCRFRFPRKKYSDPERQRDARRRPR